MRKTQMNNSIPMDQRITLSTPELKQYLGIGLSSALTIGERAGAKVRVGKRVFWHLPKIKAYLETIAE